MFNTLVSTILSASLLLTPVEGASITGIPVAGQAGQLVEQETVLASYSLDLSSRYPVTSVSDGFKENILIALGYLSSIGGSSEQPVIGDIIPQGDTLQAQRNFALSLKPGEVFAFHKKGILPQFNESKIISQESDFTTNYGYKVVAGLGGNGVCHLASLMNLVALKAGLEVVAPTNHNFDRIPGIDKEYGVSISTRNSPERQNLYIKNNFEFPMFFRFELRENNLVFSIVK